MTTLTLDTAPVLSASVPSDDCLDHVTCCGDDNLALCGTDVTADEWIPEDSPTTCVVCASLEESTNAADSCATTCPKLRKDVA